MLTIRHEQMESLREARMQAFRERLQAFLTNILERKAPGTTTDQVHTEVDALLKMAADFHLKRESDIARLGEVLCCEFGSISKSQLGREALRILYPYDVDSTEKLDRFQAWLAKNAREEKTNV
jgi:hypothetical protein